VTTRSPSALTAIRWTSRAFGVSLATSVALTACGGSSSRQAITTHPAATTAPTSRSGPSQPTATASRASSAGAAVTLTANGYVYQVALSAPGVVSATNTTTNDGSGYAGSPIDATPGHILLVATMSVTNKTDRPEPMALVGIGPLPETDVSGALSLVVPRSQANAFGLQVSDQASGLGGTMAERYCGDAQNNPQAASPAPIGYCNLNAEVIAFTPAQTDITQPPQLAPGESGSLTLLVQDTPTGAPVPEGVAANQVQVALERTLGDMTTWTVVP
jgi:hypothetical protein